MTKKTLITKMNKMIGVFPKQLRTKINNISKARVSGIAPTKRCSIHNLVCINYDIIDQNNITLKQLSSYKSGVCIYLQPSIYIKLKNMDSSDKTELDNYLMNNIGSDNNI